MIIIDKKHFFLLGIGVFLILLSLTFFFYQRLERRFESLDKEAVKLTLPQVLKNKILGEGTKLPEDYYSSLYLNVNEEETITKKLTISAFVKGEKIDEGILYLEAKRKEKDKGKTLTILGISLKEEKEPQKNISLLRITTDGSLIIQGGIVSFSLSTQKITSSSLVSDSLVSDRITSKEITVEKLTADEISAKTFPQTEIPLPLPKEYLSGDYPSITGVGTLTKGTWKASPIEDEYISDVLTFSYLYFSPLSSSPSSPKEGTVYFNQNDKKLYLFSNSSWIDLTSQGAWTVSQGYIFPKNVGETLQITDSGDLLLPGYLLSEDYLKTEKYLIVSPISQPSLPEKGTIYYDLSQDRMYYWNGSQWISMAAGEIGVSLQNAYNQGNTIITSDARDIIFTLSDTETDSNFIVNIEGENFFSVQHSSQDVFVVQAQGKLVLTPTATSGNLFTLTASSTFSSGNIFEVKKEAESKFVIDSNGNVGIGTTPGGYRLRVDASTILVTGGVTLWGTQGKLGVGNTTTPGSTLSVAGGVSVGSYYNLSAPSGGMIVSGDVGIGTSSPQASLDVAGEIKASKINKKIIVDGIRYSQDSTGIQQAINDLPPEGGEVYLPEGTYTITSTIQIPSNVWLRGAGFSTILYLADGANVTVIQNADTTNGNSNIKISDLKINGNDAGNTGTCNGIYFKKVENSVIEDVWVYDVEDYGIVLYDSSNNQVKDSIVESAGGVGIHLEGGESVYNTISNNIVKGNDYGIKVRSYAQYNTVSDNKVYSNSYQGIWLEPWGNYGRNIVKGNTVYNNGRTGIYAGANGDFSNWQVIVGNNVFENGYHGIVIVGKENTVTGNMVHDNIRHGIYISRDYNTVTGNIVTGNDSNNTASYDGIYIAGDYNIISSNRIGDNDRYEINIQGEGNYIVGNEITGTDHVGEINDNGTATKYQMDEEMRLAKEALFTLGNINDQIIDNMEDISDWTSSDDANTPISLESGTVKVGKGSLKIQTTSGSSNGDIISKTPAFSDFSQKDRIGFWIYSTSSGQIISLELDDDTATTDPHYNITINSSNTWEYKEWDLSSIAVEDRDNISSIKFIIDNDTNSPTIYIDQLRYYSSQEPSFELFVDGDGNVNFVPTQTLYISGGEGIKMKGRATGYGGANEVFILDKYGRLTLNVFGSAEGLYVNDPTYIPDFIAIKAIGRHQTGIGIYASGGKYAGQFVGDVVISGNVGIGTSSPQSKLDVAGEIKAPKINKKIIVDGIRYSKDSTGIQQAINDLPPEGGEVYLPEGTYTITSPIQIPSNVTLRGAGPSTILYLADGVNDSVIKNSDTTDGNTNIHLLDFKIIGNDAGNSGNCDGVYFYNVSYSKIENLYIEDVEDKGISIAGGDYNVITNNYLRNGGSQAGTSAISIGCSGSSSCYGKYNVVSNNVIENWTGPAVMVSEWTPGKTQYNIVANNTALNVSGYFGSIGILRADHNSVIGNIIKGGSYSGIVVSKGANYNTVSGNVITEKADHGIALDDGSDYNVVSSNTIQNVTDDGIYLSGDSDYNVISSNIFENNGGYDINISSSYCDGNYLIGNNIEKPIQDNGTATKYQMDEEMRLAKEALFTLGNINDQIIDNMEDISDWTSSDDANTPISLESGTVKVGKGSLKIQTTSGSSNGDIISKTPAFSDFSQKDRIGFWIYSTTSGQIISLELDDDTATTDPHYNITINSSNTWEYKEWDLSSIAVEDRDNISSIKFIIDNDTNSPTIYIDQLRYYSSQEPSFELFVDGDGNVNMIGTDALTLRTDKGIIFESDDEILIQTLYGYPLYGPYIKLQKGAWGATGLIISGGKANNNETPSNVVLKGADNNRNTRGGHVLIYGGTSGTSSGLKGGNVFIYGGSGSSYPGDVILGVDTSGTQRGNVGIGTISPQEKLTIGADGSIVIEMETPSGVTATATTGGSLSAGTYYYQVTALDGAGGETKASSEVSCSVDGTDTNACQISWDAVQGASSYRVYKGTSSGGENEYFETTSTTYTDTGTAGTAGTPPTVTTAYVNKISASGNSWFLGGRVGIGTSNPTSTLHVIGGGHFYAEGNNGVLIEATDHANLTIKAGPSDYDRPYISFRRGETLLWFLVVPQNSTRLDFTYGGVSNTPLFTITSTGEVGIGTTSPNSKLHVEGPIATAITTVTADYTVGDSDSVILCDASTAVVTITLPSAVGIDGREYTIKKIDSSANACTVATSGTETIDGASSYSLSNQYQYVRVVSDGANWFVIGNN